MNKIAEMVIEAMGKTSAMIQYSSGDRGWPGDVPRVRLDPKKLERLGWVAKFSSDEAIKKAITDLLGQQI